MYSRPELSSTIGSSPKHGKTSESNSTFHRKIGYREKVVLSKYQYFQLALEEFEKCEFLLPISNWHSQII